MTFDDIRITKACEHGWQRGHQPYDNAMACPGGQERTVNLEAAGVALALELGHTMARLDKAAPNTQRIADSIVAAALGVEMIDSGHPAT